MLSAQKFKCTRRFLEIYLDCLRTYSMSLCQAVDQRFSFSPEFLGFRNAILCFKKRRFRQLLTVCAGIFPLKRKRALLSFGMKNQPADFQCWTLKTQRDFLPWLSMKNEATMYRKTWYDRRSPCWPAPTTITRYRYSYIVHHVVLNFYFLSENSI